MSPERKRERRAELQEETARRSRAEDCQRMLRDRGYAPNPDCTKCGGDGRYILDAPGCPEDGKATTCNAPGCLKASMAAYHRGEPYLSGRGIRSDQTFEAFRQVEGTQKAYRATKELADGDAKFIWLAIYGGVGNGKSHLLHALAISLSGRGADVHLHDCTELMGTMRKAIKADRFEDELQIVMDRQVLILDDFRPRGDKEWEMNTMERILLHRYTELLTTVMATNIDLEGLPEWGDTLKTSWARIVSRFSDTKMSRAVHNSGKDYRMKGER